MKILHLHKPGISGGASSDQPPLEDRTEPNLQAFIIFFVFYFNKDLT